MCLEADEVVRHVNRLVAKRSLDAALELGTYLLQQFFDGRPEVFSARRGRLKSYKALAAHPGLHVSHTHLHYCLRVVVQVGQMPERLWRPLSLSHHKKLLTVDDPRLRDLWAERAINMGWSARRLQAEIRAGTGDGASPSTHPAAPAPSPVGLQTLQDEVSQLVRCLEGLENRRARELHDNPVETVRALDHAVQDLSEAFARLRRYRAFVRRSLDWRG